jgi:hypothetical protein
MKWFACSVLLLSLGILASACDEPTPLPPQALLKNPPPQEPTSRPTTQQLLEGPRREVALAEMPLTARVPAGWSVKQLDGTTMTFLEGPTPSGGDVSIQLVERAATTPEKFHIIVEGAKKELQQFPDTMRMAELHEAAGGVKVLERQRVGEAAKSSLNEPGVKESPPYSWTITVFIPRDGGKNYETCELNFIGLTVDQYEADQALLREIVDSVTVNDATTAPTAPSAGAAAH